MTDPIDLHELMSQAVSRVNPEPPPLTGLRTVYRRRRHRRLIAGAVTLALALSGIGWSVADGLSGPSRQSVRIGPAGTGMVSVPDGTVRSSKSRPGSSPTTASANPDGIAGFVITSASFLPSGLGWALGQEPCGRTVCAALRRSEDGGLRWQPARAPSEPPGQPTVDQLVFADPDNGWAFGPQLFATHDGGVQWTRVVLPGPISDLAVDGDQVLALVGDGGGTSYSVGCTAGSCAGARLWASPIAANRFALVGGFPQLTITPGYHNQVFQASLTVIDQAVYVLNASVISQLWTNATGAWTQRPLPCNNVAGPPQLLAAYSSSGLALVCPGGPAVGNQGKEAFASSDGGRHWELVASAQIGANVPLAIGNADSLSTPTSDDWLLALGRCCMLISQDGGHHWQQATSPSAPTFPNGMRYVNFTTSRQGFALPDDTVDWIALTDDGGLTWSRIDIK